MTGEKKSINKTLFSVGGLVIMLVILLLVNVLFARVNLRWDTTEDNLYSLSEGSKNILDNLKNPVSIKVFYSRSLVNIPPNFTTYANQVIDFLSEYEYYAKGKISLEIFDPKPDSEEEDWAKKYGIKGINLPAGDTFFMGLVVTSLDQEYAIPFLDPNGEERLEYELTRIICRVQSAKKQKLGIISTLPVFGAPPSPMNMQQTASEPWLFIKQLRETYDVTEIEKTAETIPEDLDLLIIIHPKKLSESLEYAIDQHILQGGNTMVFVDPFATMDQSREQNQASSLKRLFSAWGVSMETGKAVIDFDFPTRLRNQNNQVESNPAWLSLQTEAFNQDALITSEIESTLLPIAGALKKTPDSEYEYETLIESSTNSMLQDAFMVQFGAKNIRREFQPSIDKYDLAVRIRGTFKTAFPSGPPEKENEDISKRNDENIADDKDEVLKEGIAQATLVLVADTDILWDQYYVQKQNFLGHILTRMFNDNLNFFLNSVEMLAGGNNLISIRSRGSFDRPFTTVQMLEKKAQAQWLNREKELVRRVEETNQKLQELQGQKDASQKFIMSQEQEEEIRRFKEEKQRINRELKLVRRHLRSEIEALGMKVKFANIFLMPILVSLAGIGYALYQRKKSLKKES